MCATSFFHANRIGNRTYGVPRSVAATLCESFDSSESKPPALEIILRCQLLETYSVGVAFVYEQPISFGVRGSSGSRNKA
jgi:hypothetical protein